MGNPRARPHRPAGRLSRREYLSAEGLGYYMKAIKKYRALDADTEAALARSWRDLHDPRAIDLLVGSQQGMVVGIAKEHVGYGLPLCDLISEGNTGLMQAVSRFDPDRGFRLSTYAAYWVRRAMTYYVLRSYSSVKRVTTEQDKRAFFKLRGLVAKHLGTYDADLSPEAVAAISAELGVSESDVTRLNQRLGHEELSINEPVTLDDEETVEWQDLLVDPTVDLEADIIDADEMKKRRAALRGALEVLDDRERHILNERALSEEPANLATLGERYGLTRERVRQIEARAIDKLRKRIRKSALDARSSSRTGRAEDTAITGKGSPPRRAHGGRRAG